MAVSAAVEAVDARRDDNKLRSSRQYNECSREASRLHSFHLGGACYVDRGRMPAAPATPVERLDPPPDSDHLRLTDPIHLVYLANFHVDPFSLGAGFGGYLLAAQDGQAKLLHDNRLPKSVSAGARRGANASCPGTTANRRHAARGNWPSCKRSIPARRACASTTGPAIPTRPRSSAPWRRCAGKKIPMRSSCCAAACASPRPATPGRGPTSSRA